MSGNFLSCSKGVKEPFEVQVDRCDFTRDTTAEKDLISSAGGNFWSFSSCGRSLGVTMATSGTRLCGLRKGQSPCELPLAS